MQDPSSGIAICSQKHFCIHPWQDNFQPLSFLYYFSFINHYTTISTFLRAVTCLLVLKVSKKTSGCLDHFELSVIMFLCIRFKIIFCEGCKFWLTIGTFLPAVVCLVWNVTSESFGSLDNFKLSLIMFLCIWYEILFCEGC